MLLLRSQTKLKFHWTYSHYNISSRLCRCCNCGSCCLVVPVLWRRPNGHLPPAGKYLTLCICLCYHIVHPTAATRNLTHLFTNTLQDGIIVFLGTKFLSPLSVTLHAVQRGQWGLYWHPLRGVWGCSSNDHGSVCAGHHRDVQRSEQVWLHCQLMGIMGTFT